MPTKTAIQFIQLCALECAVQFKTCPGPVAVQPQAHLRGEYTVMPAHSSGAASAEDSLSGILKAKSAGARM